MENLVVALILAAAGGLGFVAHHDPDLFYERICTKILFVLGVAMALCLVWNISSDHTASTIRHTFELKDWARIEAAAKGLTVPMGWAFFAYLLSSGYVLLLAWLALQWRKRRARG